MVKGHGIGSKYLPQMLWEKDGKVLVGTLRRWAVWHDWHHKRQGRGRWNGLGLGLWLGYGRLRRRREGARTDCLLNDAGVDDGSRNRRTSKGGKSSGESRHG